MKLILCLLIGFVPICLVAQNDEKLWSLVSTASEFPPSDKNAVLSALEKIRQMPNAEEGIWELIESSELAAPFQIENGFEVLNNAKLVSEQSLVRSKELLRKHRAYNFNLISGGDEQDPQVSDFGFGAPVGLVVEEKRKVISLLVGSLKILRVHGDASDLQLIDPYTESISSDVRDAAQDAVASLENKELKDADADADADQGVSTVDSQTVRDNEIKHESESNEGIGWFSRIVLIAFVCAVVVLVIFGIKKLGGGKGSAGS